MDKKLHETTNICVEIMKSKRQGKEKLGYVRGTNSRLPYVRRKRNTRDLKIEVCHLTANGNPRFAVSGFTLSVCPYLFVFIQSFTSILTEKSS